jgi:16S rRNA (cytosine967-C5)-methyltransferase
MSNPRIIAVDILNKITEKRLTFDEALSREPRINTLEQRDKNFLFALVLTTLRHFGEIDHFLNKFTRGKSNILRAGVAQIKYMELPPYAVVDEMVNCAESKEHKSFINAILRKVPEYEFEKRAALNFPKWMLGSWKKAYGADRLEGFLPFLITEPPLDISLKQVHGAWSTEHVILPNGSVRLKDAGNISVLPGYEAGDWWVQDSSSTFAVEIMGDVKGKKVLDMCAAPGGKTAQLIDKGAIVTAIDDSAKRVERLKENLERLKMTAETEVTDATTYKGRFEAILLDAPCTSTGTIRRNPEIASIRTEDDVKEMVALQQRLLDNAAKLTNKGGILVYAVCSLQYEEAEGQVRKLADKWQLLEEKRILPSNYAEFGGTGGFYCAKLQKL